MPSPARKAEKDEVYYWDTVRFLVEETVFKLPRYQFVVGSEYFAKTYLQNTCPPTPQFNDAPDPDDDWGSMDVTDAPRLRISTAGAVELEGVTAEEFRVFLKLLFPVHSTSTELKFSKPEWLTILTLSTRWHFLEFRKLAIANLDADMTDPVEMITVGRREYVSKWVKTGYEKLVMKKDAISEEESETIGYQTAVRLYIARHELSPYLQEDKPECSTCLSSYNTLLIAQEVERKFETELEGLRNEQRSRRTPEDVERDKARELVLNEKRALKKARKAKRAAAIAAGAERQETRQQPDLGAEGLKTVAEGRFPANEAEEGACGDAKTKPEETLRQQPSKPFALDDPPSLFDPENPFFSRFKFTSPTSQGAEPLQGLSRTPNERP